MTKRSGGLHPGWGYEKTLPKQVKSKSLVITGRDRRQGGLVKDTMIFGFHNPHNPLKMKNNILWHMNLMGYEAGIPGTADKSAVVYQTYWVACMLTGIGAE